MLKLIPRYPKQNLKVNAFIGNSENDVITQSYALIVQLLLCCAKVLCNLSVTLQNFIRILHLNLFHTRPVQELFEPAPPMPDNMIAYNQLSLPWLSGQKWMFFT